MLNFLIFLVHSLSFTNSNVPLHPFYLSVSEIKYNSESKHLELSVKIFIDDFENTLHKVTGQSINLTFPKDPGVRDQLVDEYIQKNLILTINGKPITIQFLGLEKEEEAVWCYFESDACELPSTVQIKNTLLYQALEGQINIMHVTVGNQRKSLKVDQPEFEAAFQF